MITLEHIHAELGELVLGRQTGRADDQQITFFKSVGLAVQDAIARLRPVIAAIPNVSANPAPDIEILQFTPEGPLLCVRPYTHTDNYWQVYFETHKAIVSTFGTAGYPVPETPVSPRNR